MEDTNTQGQTPAQANDQSVQPNATGGKKVEIYSTPTCHFCHMTKDFLKEHNVEFTDYNVGEDAEKRSEMMQKSGQMGVPVIVITDGDKEDMMVGFNEPKLREVLNIA